MCKLPSGRTSISLCIICFLERWLHSWYVVLDAWTRISMIERFPHICIVTFGILACYPWTSTILWWILQSPKLKCLLPLLCFCIVLISHVLDDLSICWLRILSSRIKYLRDLTVLIECLTLCKYMSITISSISKIPVLPSISSKATYICSVRL